jgi:hypothetical protein
MAEREALLADAAPAEINRASRAKSPKARGTFGDFGDC